MRGSCIPLLLVGLLTSSPAFGQSRTVLRTCVDCGIHAVAVARLGSELDAHTPAERPHYEIVEAANGHFFVPAGPPVSRIIEYDEQGSFIKIIGGDGDGPGEFRSIRQLLDMGSDSIGVLDASQQRLTVIGLDGVVYRTQALPMRPKRIARSTSGALIVGGMEYTRSGIGYASHVILPGSNTATPLEPSDRVLPSSTSSTDRIFAVSGEKVWVVRPDDYTLTRWTVDGRKEFEIIRQASWYDEVASRLTLSRDGLEGPVLADLFADSVGQIWTMVQVPTVPLIPSTSMPDWHRQFTTVVEVFDATTGELVASQRFSWFGSGFSNTGLFVSYHHTDSGVLVLDVWRPELVNEEKGGPDSTKQFREAEHDARKDAPDSGEDLPNRDRSEK